MNKMRCPHCGHNFAPPAPELPVVSVESLRRWCQENGVPVYPIDRVSPEGAARILGLNGKTLKNWRALGSGPPVVRTGAGRGRITYRLVDLAESMRGEDFVP